MTNANTKAAGINPEWRAEFDAPAARGYCTRGGMGCINTCDEYCTLRLLVRAAIAINESRKAFLLVPEISRHILTRRGSSNFQGFNACCSPVTSKLGGSSTKLPCQS